jgi:hypothetical protein
VPAAGAGGGEADGDAADEARGERRGDRGARGGEGAVGEQGSVEGSQGRQGRRSGRGRKGGCGGLPGGGGDDVAGRGRGRCRVGEAARPWRRCARRQRARGERSDTATLCSAHLFQLVVHSCEFHNCSS